MDNFLPDSTAYQLPSIMDDINVNMEGIEQEPSEFLKPSLEGHEENLAVSLPKSVLDRISAELVEGIEEDINSRKDWEDNLAEAIDLLGIKIDKNISFPFEGACGAFSPVMMQGLIDFISVAIAELLPLEGPAKQYIVGETTDEIQDQADRIESFFNIFLTKQCKEYYADTKKLLVWVYVTGMVIRKSYFDRHLMRPTVAFLMPQDFIVNYGTTNLETCWRITEVLNLNKIDVARRENDGTFLKLDLSPDDGGDESTLRKTLDRVQGVENSSTDNDISYTFYECHTNIDIDSLEDYPMNGKDILDDDTKIGISSSSGLRPYRVTIHKKTNKIVSLYRNWEEGDEEYKRINCYTDFGFAEGLGFYKLGAVHMIGGLSKLSTTTLRQISDGQTLANFPGGLRVKGMPLKNNNIPIGPCEFPEIDTGGLPINQAIMTMPYKEPSPQVNVIRNEIDMAASRIMGSSNAQIPEFQANAPVGTTLALLDVLNLIQSTVLRGLRDSMSREFEILYRLFSETLSETPYEFNRDGGKSYISRYDFIDQISMVPIADPHVTTKMQRIMRSQYIQDLCLKFSGLYDHYEVNKIALKEIKLTDSQIDKVLPNKRNIPALDPISEVMNLMRGQPVKAYIQQNHSAHRIVIQDLLNNPNTQPNVIAAAMSLDAEHAAFEYQIQMQQKTGIQLPADPSQLPPDAQNQIAMMAAQALMQQQQAQQESQPPPLLDPAAVMLEKVKVEDKSVDQRESASERETQLKAFIAQLDYDAKIKSLEIKEEEMQLKVESGKI